MKRIAITGFILVLAALWLAKQKPATAQDVSHYAGMAVCRNDGVHSDVRNGGAVINESIFPIDPTDKGLLTAQCPAGWSKKAIFFRYYTQEELIGH